MPIFIGYHHLLNYFLYVFISRFNRSIHLWPIGGRIMMLNLEFFAQFRHHLIVQISGIINDNSFRNSISTNQILPYKFCHHFPGYISIRSSLNPFSEIVNGHQYESMSIWCFWFNSSNDVYTPHGKRPQCR